MTMQKSTGVGAVLMLDNGTLMKECCCGGSPSSCPDSDPEALLTVSGSSGTINWCGETWNLPADSGQTRTVCPTLYTQYQYTATGLTPNGYRAENVWAHFVAGANRLTLRREYGIIPTVNNTGWYRGRGSTYNNLAQINLNAYTNGGEDKIYWSGNFSIGDPTRPVAPTNTNLSYSYLGILTVGEPIPYWNDYGITDSQFSTFTKAGITYTWARGNGW